MTNNQRKPTRPANAKSARTTANKAKRQSPGDSRKTQSLKLAKPLTRAQAGLVLVGIAIALVVLSRIAVFTAVGQRWDNWMMLTARWSSFVDSVAHGVKDTGLSKHRAPLYVQTDFIWIAVLALLGLGMIYRRWRDTLKTALAVALTVGTTQIIKRLVIDRPDLGQTLRLPNSFPSGHSAGIIAAGLALLVIAPIGMAKTARTLAVTWMVAAAWTMLCFGWHRPLDVFAAILVGAFWFVLIFGVIAPSRTRANPDVQEAPSGSAADESQQTGGTLWRFFTEGNPNGDYPEPTLGDHMRARRYVLHSLVLLGIGIVDAALAWGVHRLTLSDLPQRGLEQLSTWQHCWLAVVWLLALTATICLLWGGSRLACGLMLRLPGRTPLKGLTQRPR